MASKDADTGLANNSRESRSRSKRDRAATAAAAAVATVADAAPTRAASDKLRKKHKINDDDDGDDDESGKRGSPHTRLPHVDRQEPQEVEESKKEDEVKKPKAVAEEDMISDDDDGDDKNNNNNNNNNNSNNNNNNESQLRNQLSYATCIELSTKIRTMAAEFKVHEHVVYHALVVTTGRFGRVRRYLRNRATVPFFVFSPGEDTILKGVDDEAILKVGQRCGMAALGDRMTFLDDDYYFPD